jgi:hypothetical protein
MLDEQDQLVSFDLIHHLNHLKFEEQACFQDHHRLFHLHRLQQMLLLKKLNYYLFYPHPVQLEYHYNHLHHQRRLLLDNLELI